MQDKYPYRGQKLLVHGLQVEKAGMTSIKSGKSGITNDLQEFESNTQTTPSKSNFISTLPVSGISW